MRVDVELPLNYNPVGPAITTDACSVDCAPAGYFVRVHIRSLVFEYGSNVYTNSHPQPSQGIQGCRFCPDLRFWKRCCIIGVKFYANFKVNSCTTLVNGRTFMGTLRITGSDGAVTCSPMLG